jgi:hypothetical protein
MPAWHIINNLTVMQGDNPIAEARSLCVMGHHQERALVLLLEIVQQAKNLSACGGVEIAGRLIPQQQRRTEDERPRDRDTLTLAAREFIGTVNRPVLEAHMT